MKEPISAIVLAGGRSSRMGQDKALIPVDGVPLLQRTCEVARQCAASVTVITFYPDKYQAIVPPCCNLLQEQPLAYEQADDPRPHGALVGFAQALATVKTPWAVLLACDLPYLQTPILQRWMGQIPPEDTAIALLPHTEKGWEPLCGFYHRSCLTTLVPLINQGGRSFQQWLTQVPVQAITPSPLPEESQQESQMLFNCNTPADLRRLLLAQSQEPTHPPLLSPENKR
ncbi:MAG: molybdenum cofactor guanylyltransferase [Leptolyngbyaceae cyanobacterium bins.302]|nr:molybdenum cofactor guanylyltransferase [Leptolyngbyaceae cyanobacterium bins.302]